MNLKKVFISGLLIAGTVFSSPLAIFASDKSEEEKKPFKCFWETMDISKTYSVINSTKVIEARKYARQGFLIPKIIVFNAVTVKFGAFSQCVDLTDVCMPAVREIGWFAFMECSNLKNIIIPNVKEISCCSFFCCSSLERVDLRNVEKIGDTAFAGCKNLKRVLISDNVAAVSKDAFYDCSDDLEIEYKGHLMSKEKFFRVFKGETRPTVTSEEVYRLYL